MSHELSDVQETGPRYLDGSGPEDHQASTSTDTSGIGVNVAPPVMVGMPVGQPQTGSGAPPWQNSAPPMPGYPRTPPVGYAPRPTVEPENTSGMMGDVPPEIEKMGFHWGACLLSTYWAKEHNITGLATLQGGVIAAWLISYFCGDIGIQGAWIVGLLCLLTVPALAGYFGMIGYREGWRYRHFPGGVSEYLEEQRMWTRRAFIIIPVGLVALAVLFWLVSLWIKAWMPGGHFTRGGDGSDTTPTRSTISAPVRPANTPPAQPANTVVTPPPAASSNSGAGSTQTPTYSNQPTGSYTTQAPAAAPSQQQPTSTTYPPTSTAPASTPGNSGYGASPTSTAPAQDQPPVDNSATPSQQAPDSQAPPQSSTGTDTSSPRPSDPNSAPPATYQSGQPVDNSGAPAQ